MIDASTTSTEGKKPTEDVWRGTRHVITVGGGRGGVGKSLVTVNLGVYLAQLGREVLIADADITGSSLHIQLGLHKPPFANRDAVEDVAIEPVMTSVPGLRMLPAPFDITAASPFRPGRKARWLSKLRGLPADYILLNLGAGASPATLDLFLASDLGICVTAPDPASVESTYRFVRSLFLRSLRRALMKERFRLRLVERAMQNLGALPSPLEVIAAIAQHDRNVADIAAQQLNRARSYLIVNQTRLRSDIELGSSMQEMSRRYLGMPLEYIGHVENDDQAWLTARRKCPLLVDSPTAKSARNLERIARRVVGMVTSPEINPLTDMLPDERRETLYEVLGVSRGASDEDVRRAYKRQRELYSTASLPLVSLLDDGQVRKELARIQEAYDTILDPVRRRAYNVSTFSEDDNSDADRPTRANVTPDQLMLQAELAREVHAETEFTGGLLRKVRESQGLELKEISDSTRISLAHLSALEEERYDELPALVYVRGFLQQVSRFLKLDPTQVVKTYVRRMRETLALRGQA